jgi:hypothetical protein
VRHQIGLAEWSEEVFLTVVVAGKERPLRVESGRLGV